MLPASKGPQYIAAISATVGGIEMGSTLGWMAPAAAQLGASGYAGFTVSLTQSSLLGGILTVGAMIGSSGAGPLADRVGRKTLMLVQIIPWIIGWAFILWASSIWMLFAGRLILGINIGMISVAAPVYVNEIAQTEIQGTLGALFIFMSSAGILYAYILGKYLSLFWVSLGCALLTVPYLGLMLLMPESPRYYLMKRRKADAKTSLQWLRGSQYDITNELGWIQSSVEKADKEKVSMRKAFTSRAAKRGLLVGIGLMILQQFCGVDSIIFYTVTIFQDTGSNMSAIDCTIISGVIAFIMCFLSAFIVDRLGRRPLLLASCIAQAISSVALGIYYFMKNHGQDVEKLGWLPLTSIAIFDIFFAVGLGPIPWMLMVEVFPAAVRGPATSLAVLVNWAGAVIVTSSFGPLKQAIGASIVFWIYGAFSALGIAFVAFIVPETKGKDIDEVTAILSGNSKSNNSC